MNMDDTEFTERPELLRKRAWAGAMSKIAVTLLVVWMVGMMIANIVMAMEADQQRDLLIDCTSPKGECFKRGQERTGAAILDINRITVLAAYCADQATPQTVAEIQRCIEEKLEGR